MKIRRLCIGLTCCVLLLCGCSSVNSVVKNIKEGNIDEAVDLYQEKIAGDPEKEIDLEDSVQIYIEDLYDTLNSGNTSPEEVQIAVNTVASIPMEYGSYTHKLLSKLSDLAQSKMNYDDAQNAIAREDYITAYQLLANVIPEDSDYDMASAQRDEVLNTGIQLVCAEAQDAIDRKEFQEAIDRIDEARLLWGDSELLDEQYSQVNQQWLQSNIDQAEQLRDAGQYAEAEAKVREFFSTSDPEDYPGMAAEEITKISDDWWQSVQSKAQAAFGANKDYQAAIQVLQESGLSGDAIDAEIEYYRSYAPIMLKDLRPTTESDYMFAMAAEKVDYTDVNGHEYDKKTIIRPRTKAYNNFAKSESDAYITYYLGGNYCTFDAVLYRTYSSLSVLDEDWPQSTMAKIYGDDVLLYEGPQITQSTYEEYPIHLDITGVRELKFVLMGVGNYGDYYSDCPLLCFANGAIQK